MEPYRNVELRKGFFPDTAAGIEDQTFGLVHVDADIYRSVLDCCEFFYPRLRPGAAMVFDDYGCRTTPGAKEAVDEFCEGQSLTPFCPGTGQAVLWKR
jgi:O-methyltransferase